LNLQGFLNYIALAGFRSKRSELYSDLAEMFEAGQNLRKFIELQTAITKRTKQDSFNKAYMMMLHRFDGGDHDNTLPELLDGIVPESDMAPLTAIEQGGALRKHTGLRELADSILRESLLRSMVLKSLVMPLIMIPFIGYLSYILADVVIAVDQSSPDFLKEVVFTGFNELVRVLSIYTRDYGAVIFMVMIASFISIALILPTWIGALRLKFDGFPIFGLYRDFQSAKVFSSLAMLLESGKKLIPSLELVGSRGSKWTKWQIRRILGSLEESPTGYIDAFSMGICSPYVEGRLTILTNILHERESRGDYKLDFSDVIVSVGKKEIDKTLERIQYSSLIMNTALLMGLFTYASILGLGSMTVPGKFAESMEPNTMTVLKMKYEAKKKMEAASYSSK